jgi:predicted DNA-binding transcriptional regulator AlpA
MEMSTSIEPELLILKQASALCGVSDKTFWTWANSGLAPPALHIGPQVTRYSRQAIMRWIANGCQPMNRQADAQGNGNGEGGNGHLAGATLENDGEK